MFFVGRVNPGELRWDLAPVSLFLFVCEDCRTVMQVLQQT